MSVLVTCFFALAVLATSQGTPPLRQFVDQLEPLNPVSHADLREARKMFLQSTESLIAQQMAGLGEVLCRGSDIDWRETWNATVQRGEEIDVEGETLCALIDNHVEHVFEPLAGTLDQCGTAQRSGPLGRSIVLALKSLVKHFCSIKGEQILEMSNTCAFEGRLKAPECKQFKDKMEALRPGRTTGTFVHELCNSLPLGKECLMDAIGQHCSLEYTKQAWEELLDAILSPCSLTQ